MAKSLGAFDLPPGLVNRRRALRLLVTAFGAGTFAIPALAAKYKASEAELKTAYIYNFALFTTWPPAAFPPNSPDFVIATIGDHPFESEFERSLTKSAVRGRPIKVLQLPKGSEAPTCHVLYVAPSERQRVEDLLKQTQAKPILTVGDSDPFCRIGGCVRFERKRTSLGLVINPAAVKAQGLSMTPDLLAIARIVESGK